MMKFSRPYERSILVYREESGGRILLRLGRTYEDGESKPDKGTKIPPEFELLTYILSKDSVALLKDISQRFSEYADHELGAFDSIVFDALKLQDRIKAEMASGENSEIIRNIESLYGKQVMETLFAATFGEDVKAALRSAKKAKAQASKAQRDIPTYKIAASAFVAIVAIPLGVTALLKPEAINLAPPKKQDPGIILEYAQKRVPSVASELQKPPVRREPSAAEIVFEEARALKQSYYFSAGFGTAGDSYGFRRTFTPSPSASGSHGSDDHPLPESIPDIQDASPALLPQEDADQTLSIASSLIEGFQPEDEAGAAARVTTSRPGQHGLPEIVGRFVLDEFDVYDSFDAAGETGLGVTGIYDLARAPRTIFDVTQKDIGGLAPSLDAAVSTLCSTIEAPGETSESVLSANLVFELGRSEFIAIYIDEESCEARAYDIFPMFEISLPQEGPGSNGSAAALE